MQTNNSYDSGSDSDYIVEYYIKPNKISVPIINDERADLLGNFDDRSRKEISNSNKEFTDESTKINVKSVEDELKYVTDSDNDEGNVNETKNISNVNSEDVNQNTKRRKQIDISTESNNIKGSNSTTTADMSKAKKTITKDQITELLRGTSKSNRFVLYVTNLSFTTTKSTLENYFTQCGSIKGIRIPKSRKAGFAFIEMSDFSGFEQALTKHNQQLDGRSIKIQISEAGKKKSANKKNILKQKNRKLATMRNETKTFYKSGKNYDKSIKKELEKERLIQERIRQRRIGKRNKK